MPPSPRDNLNGQPKSYTQPIYSLQKGQRAQTFDPGSRAKTTTESQAIRTRFQKIVKSLPVARTNTYRHEPIDYEKEIRILKILHGEGTEGLVCMLFPSQLHPEKELVNGNGKARARVRKDPYWALSYWWGDVNEVAGHKITIYHE